MELWQRKIWEVINVSRAIERIRKRYTNAFEDSRNCLDSRLLLKPEPLQHLLTLSYSLCPRLNRVFSSNNQDYQRHVANRIHHGGRRPCWGKPIFIIFRMLLMRTCSRTSVNLSFSACVCERVSDHVSRKWWLFHDEQSRFSLRVILVVSSLLNRDLRSWLSFLQRHFSRQHKKNLLYNYKYSTNVKYIQIENLFWSISRTWNRIIFKEINSEVFKLDVLSVRVSSWKRAAVSAAIYSCFHN